MVKIGIDLFSVVSRKLISNRVYILSLLDALWLVWIWVIFLSQSESFLKWPKRI